MFKGIDLLIKQGRSFAVYRFPDQRQPVLVIGDDNSSQVVYYITELRDLRGFVIAPFEVTKNKPIVCIEPDITISGHHEIAQFLSQAAHGVDSLSITQSNTYFAQYNTAFDKFSKALVAKKFEKLVLSRPSDYSMQSAIPYFSLLNRAMDLYPNSFVYLCHTPQTGTWMGASPELLLKGSSSKWETVALAGTQHLKKGQTVYGWDSKNTQEQQLVSEYIKELFDEYRIDYEQQTVRTVEVGKLAHLRTPFSFRLQDSARVVNLIEKLHPTPAICGLPKEDAYRFILKNEGYDRSYYSGFIGYFDIEKETNLYVNLRCMNIEATRLRLYAGGGLLTSSNLDSEWNETEAKLQTMLSLLSN